MTLHDDILAEADKIIAGDRRVDYGDVTDSFVALASLWTWYLKTKFKVDFELTGIDVAMIMTLMKVSRGTTGAAKRDNLVDICGYAALGARFLAVDKVKSNQEKVEDLILKAVDQAKEAEEGTPLQHKIAFIPLDDKAHIYNLDSFKAYAEKKVADLNGYIVYSIRYRKMDDKEPTGMVKFPYKEAWKVEKEGGLVFYHDRVKAGELYESTVQVNPHNARYPVRVMYEVLP